MFKPQFDSSNHQDKAFIWYKSAYITLGVFTLLRTSHLAESLNWVRNCLFVIWSSTHNILGTWSISWTVVACIVGVVGRIATLAIRFFFKDLAAILQETSPRLENPTDKTHWKDHTPWNDYWWTLIMKSDRSILPLTT